MDSDRVREGLCPSDDHIGDCLGDSLRIVDRVALDSLSTIRLRVEIVPVSPLLTEDEAISLISVAVDFGVTQVVDGNWGIHAIIKKSLFAGTVA